MIQISVAGLADQSCVNAMLKFGVKGSYVIKDTSSQNAIRGHDVGTYSSYVNSSCWNHECVVVLHKEPTIKALNRGKDPTNHQLGAWELRLSTLITQILVMWTIIGCGPIH